ncbi:hypothetical protein FGB62_139g09 [Gracilaria domingensis]|nr:hypothetical protein FGB62_139g09 [Gracilaria domingensis]
MSKRSRSSNQASTPSQKTVSTRSVYENSWEQDMQIESVRGRTSTTGHEENFIPRSSTSEESVSEERDDQPLSPVLLPSSYIPTQLGPYRAGSCRLPRIPVSFRRPEILSTLQTTSIRVPDMNLSRISENNDRYEQKAENEQPPMEHNEATPHTV